MKALTILAISFSLAFPLEALSNAPAAVDPNKECRWLATIFQAIAIMRDSGIPLSAAQRILLQEEAISIEFRALLLPKVERIYTTLSFMNPDEILEFMLVPCDK